MQLPQVSVATGDERSRVMSAVLLGFAADPLVRWFYPEAADYVNSIPVFDAFAGGAIDQGAAFRTEHFEGAALWHTPGHGPDEERLVSLLQDSVRESAQEDVFRVFEAMGEYHPHEDHWYLPVIGVDPNHQGRGLGAALMKFALQRIDAAGLPAYLESSNPRNIPLYERHGFECMGEIQFGESPPVTPMLRPAQSVSSR